MSKRVEGDFRRGSRNSSSLMHEPCDDVQIMQFMKSSFYLPIDILQDGRFFVYPIRKLTGKQFAETFPKDDDSELHCLESYELLADALWVAVSGRRERATGRTWYVAKLWYGEK